MFYNKTAFDTNGWTVPTTWDEMWALCQQIKGTAGYENVNPLGYDSDANWYITLSGAKEYRLYDWRWQRPLLLQ
jgi:N-acetylglucosamine transport system substrate-binding protein